MLRIDVSIPLRPIYSQVFKKETFIGCLCLCINSFFFQVKQRKLFPNYAAKQVERKISKQEKFKQKNKIQNKMYKLWNVLSQQKSSQWLFIFDSMLLNKQLKGIEHTKEPHIYTLITLIFIFIHSLWLYGM